MTQYLTVPEAASLLHLHPQTVYRAIRNVDGVGELFRKVNGRQLVNQAKLESWIESKD